jgi:proline iminopeptidase
MLSFSILLNVGMSSLFTRILMGSFRFPSARRRGTVMIGLFLCCWIILYSFGIQRKLPGSPMAESHILRSLTSTFTAEDGSKIAYLQYSPDSLALPIPLVYLHPGPGAYGLENEALTDLLSTLAGQGIASFAFDRPGSGLSDRLENPALYSRERQIEYLHQILQNDMLPEQVFLLGESYGAVLAARYAASYPSQIAGLILLSPGPLYNRFSRESTNLYSRLPMAEKKTVTGMRAQFRVWTASLMSQRNPQTARQFLPDEEADAWFSRLFLKMTPGGFCDSLRTDYPAGRAGFWSSLWTARNERGDTSRVSISDTSSVFPVLILRGRCDYLPETVIMDYYNLFPHTRILQLEDAGHFIMNERTKILEEIIVSEMKAKE